MARQTCSPNTHIYLLSCRLAEWTRLIYLAGAVILSVELLHAVVAARQSTREQSRQLLKVSVIYLQLLLGLMTLNR